MSSKSSKRHGRPIVVDGKRYYWKVRIENELAMVCVLMPTGRRLRAPFQWQYTKREITPKDVAAFIRSGERP
jgi:hypothetical protein